jgi:glycerophosphoryl diester phosphodiesterase
MHHGGIVVPANPSPISQSTDTPEYLQHSWNQSFLKIGHGGASGHALANSLHSLTLALEMGVDVVEFDVRPCRDALVLLHDDNLIKYHRPDGFASQSTLEQLRILGSDPKRQIATLEEALDLIKGRALMNIDLKAAGYETSVLELVTARGLLGDVIFSSVIPSSLRLIRHHEPGAMIGLSYPEDRGDASSKPNMQPLVNIVLAWMRFTLPYRVQSMMANAGANAVMLYHKIVTQSVIQGVQQAGGKVFTWTVDDPARIQSLQEMGVNGIATNHPNLFNPGSTSQ